MQLNWAWRGNAKDAPMSGEHCTPNIVKFASKLVKRQPCCKRVGHSIFCDLVFSNNSWSIGQPPPNRKCLGTSLGNAQKYILPPPNRIIDLDIWKKIRLLTQQNDDTERFCPLRDISSSYMIAGSLRSQERIYDMHLKFQ